MGTRGLYKLAMDNAAQLAKAGSVVPRWAAEFFEAMITSCTSAPARAKPRGVWKFDKRRHPFIAFCPAKLDTHLQAVPATALKKMLRGYVGARGGLPPFLAVQTEGAKYKVLEAEVNLYKRGSNSRNMQRGLRSKLKNLEAEATSAASYKKGFELASNMLGHLEELAAIESAMRDKVYTFSPAL